MSLFAVTPSRLTVTFVLISALSAGVSAQTRFWSPAVPPRAHYAVDVSYSAATQQLEGTEVIRFRNDTVRPIGRIALEWFGDVSRVRANGTDATPAPGKQSLALFVLPQDLRPGEQAEISVDYRAAWKLDERRRSSITSRLNPRLWWDSGTHDDYEVRVRVPDGYAVATSGRLDPGSGTYRAKNLRAFGLFIGQGYQTLEADADGVQVRAVFTPKARACAELLVRTAVDAVGFYRQRYGFYPQPQLSIVPGMDHPAGGYPAATGLVVVHGQERLSERPETFWRWITAHEIGHQYWSEHVLAEGRDPLSWLMIGLGIRADGEYRLARGITDVGRQASKYIRGVTQGLDTTMDVTVEKRATIKWDFNNIVDHGKSAALVDALAAVIGADAFEVVYRRCLREYAGRPLGWREFQQVAEAESGQNLGWFFEQWVRSSRNADYRVVGQECSGTDGAFRCTVRVERVGAMRIPVTVAARFEDGSEQRSFTERLADIDELTFRSTSPLKEVSIEPDSAIAMAKAPSAAVREVMAKVADLPWTGAGQSALAIYHQARDMAFDDPSPLFRLALALYDGAHYQEAVDVFAKVALSEAPELRFGALTWQGHALDLLGRRAEALTRYEEALKVPGSPSLRHDQYRLTIDKAWVQERLKAPFERR
jgi:tetratricopeptide (TPR) repeat protein